MASLHVITVNGKVQVEVSKTEKQAQNANPGGLLDWAAKKMASSKPCSFSSALVSANGSCTIESQSGLTHVDACQQAIIMIEANIKKGVNLNVLSCAKANLTKALNETGNKA